MRWPRTVLALLLLIAVPAQSIAATGCFCESPEDSAGAGMHMAADQMTHHSDGADADHEDSHSCENSDAVCECSACIQLPAPIPAKSDVFMFGADLNQSSVAGYTDPVPIPALRPPISI